MDQSRLAERLRNGDIAALEALYNAHFAELCRYAGRITGSVAAAEEVVEDVFVALWRNRAGLAVRTSLRAYLFGAVRRHALLQQRTTSNRQRILDQATRRGEHPGASSGSARPDEELEALELGERFRAAMAALPDRPREAFRLRRGHGLSQAEVAEAMGVSESTVEKHLARAMDALREVLAQWRRDG